MENKWGLQNFTSHLESISIEREISYLSTYMAYANVRLYISVYERGLKLIWEYRNPVFFLPATINHVT